METHWPKFAQVHTLVFDFDGVFTDNKVTVHDDGHESVRCDRADGLAFDLLRGYCQRHVFKLECMILSTERNPVVTARAKKLKIACEQAVGDKLAFLTQYLAQRHPDLAHPFAGIIYFGNDLNDLAVMGRVGFSVVPADAHTRVRRAASLVVPRNGGDGFVRAALEEFLSIEHMTPEDIHELVRHSGSRYQP